MRFVRVSTATLTSLAQPRRKISLQPANPRPAPCAAAVAQAFGVRGVRIEHPDQLTAEIAQALTSAEPVLIDVPTRSELEEVPPVHAWQQAASGT